MKPYTEDKLWKYYQRKRSLRWRNLLIEQYRPLVRYHAERVGSNMPVDIADLVSAGIFGLIKAIESFDPARGVKFTSYSAKRIRGAMYDSLRDLDWIPRLTRTRHNQLIAKRKAIENGLGRPISDQEFARHLQMSYKAYSQMTRNIRLPAFKSLDYKTAQHEDKNEVCQLDILAGRQKNNPLKNLQRAEARREIVRGMSRVDATIISLYYWEGMTMRDVGKAVGLTESRVSQRHSSILKRLKSQPKTIKKILNNE